MAEVKPEVIDTIYMISGDMKEINSNLTNIRMIMSDFTKKLQNLINLKSKDNSTDMHSKTSPKNQALINKLNKTTEDVITNEYLDNTDYKLKNLSIKHEELENKFNKILISMSNRPAEKCLEHFSKLISNSNNVTPPLKGRISIFKKIFFPGSLK